MLNNINHLSAYWQTLKTCVLMTQRRHDDEWNVYAFRSDGFREIELGERQFSDINDAIDYASSWGAEPRSLLIENSNFETLADWRSCA